MENAEPIFRDRNTAIPWKEASDILSSPSSYRQAAVLPVKPKAGEVYLFQATSEARKSKIHVISHGIEACACI